MEYTDEDVGCMTCFSCLTLIRSDGVECIDCERDYHRYCFEICTCGSTKIKSSTIKKVSEDTFFENTLYLIVLCLIAIIFFSEEVRQLIRKEDMGALMVVMAVIGFCGWLQAWRKLE